MENNEINSIVGDAFEDMSISEMTNVQGSGDVDLEATPATVVTSSGGCLAASGALSGAIGSTALSIAKC
jgi:type 2 lantibiotic (TIGR03893 family)